MKLWKEEQISVEEGKAWIGVGFGFSELKATHMKASEYIWKNYGRPEINHTLWKEGMRGGTPSWIKFPLLI